MQDKYNHDENTRSLDSTRSKLNRVWAFEDEYPDNVQKGRIVEVDGEPIDDDAENLRALFELEMPALQEKGPVIAKSKPREDLPPVPWTGKEPPLVLAKNGGFFSMDELHPSKLVHTMFLGGTGVGKSTSGVLPLMRGLLRYTVSGTDGNQRQSAMLVIDPKHELRAALKSELVRVARDLDLIHLGSDSDLPPLRFFEPGDGLTVRDKVNRLDAVLQTNSHAQGNHTYWHDAALLTLTQLLNLEQVYAIRCFGVSLLAVLSAAILNASTGERWKDLDRLLTHSRRGEKQLKVMAATLAELLRSYGLENHEDAGVLEQFLTSGDEYTQWHYRMQSLHPIVSLLAEASETGVVNFDPFPSDEKPSLDTRMLLDAGMVLLFQPKPTPSSALMARSIKFKAYEAVRTRSDMERPVGIVIDELQRFVTNDEVTGDAHFLDIARAYRVNCVLATQSVGSLLLALGNDNKARAAVDAILANTPSKWFFASKDTATRDTVRSLIPSLPGRPHITDVRTLAQLETGQAYWSLANGQWGLHHAELTDLL